MMYRETYDFPPLNNRKGRKKDTKVQYTQTDTGKYNGSLTLSYICRYVCVFILIVFNYII